MGFSTRKCLLLLVAILGLLTALSEGKRIKERIYRDLNERGFCFRRTNGTHQMGCSSDPNGNVGVVHLISNLNDRDWLINKGPHDPYIVILTPKMFSRQNLELLKNSGKINGVLLLGANKNVDLLEPPNSFSDDSTCPNQDSSMYGKQACQKSEWNPFGTGILQEDWPFPMFLIDNSEKVDDLIDCFEKFNKPNEDESPKTWPLCAAELKSHMISAVDTKTCLRRNELTNPFSPTRFCDPMGDRNAFHLAHQENFKDSKYAEKSVLLLSSRIDSVTMFDKVEIGYDSPTSSLVTLIATAELLYRYRVKKYNLHFDEKY